MDTGLIWSKLRMCSIIAATLLLPHLHADVLIAPDDPGINYYGRFDFSDPKKPTFNWSGAIIEAKFPGPTIGMSVDHGNAYYDIEIDGIRDTIIATGSKQQFVFRSNLSTTEHTVRIKLRSEDHGSVGTFLGLYLADGKALGAAPAKPVRKIEFLGDSYTAGYGIESTSRDCTPDVRFKLTNANLTFARNVTNAFHAQSIILGWSGAGVVKNYEPATAKRSAEPFPFFYDRLLGAADTKTWNFSTWIPDLVVICLGTNDYTYNRNPTSNPAPDDSMYIGDYHKLIGRILTNYPDASILCVSTGDATFEKNVKVVVSEQKTIYNNSKAYFAPYPQALDNAACDWHPSINDNLKVAKVLIDTIMKKTGWDTTSASVKQSYAQKNALSSAVGFHINQSIEAIYIQTGFERSEKIAIFSFDGKKTLYFFTDEKGQCRVSKSSLHGKSFVIGNSKFGWRKFFIVR